jgi:hypothetical protein
MNMQERYPLSIEIEGHKYHAQSSQCTLPRAKKLCAFLRNDGDDPRYYHWHTVILYLQGYYYVYAYAWDRDSNIMLDSSKV